MAEEAEVYLGSSRYLTLDGAKLMCAAAEAEAKRNGWTVAIAIVDSGPNLVLFHKCDHVQPGSIDIAIGKAKTAANFKRPTKAMEDIIAGGRQCFLAVNGICPIQGGIPIIYDGQLIGAIGVSGR